MISKYCTRMNNPLAMITIDNAGFDFSAGKSVLWEQRNKLNRKFINGLPAMGMKLP
jgi:hypothetical protein